MSLLSRERYVAVLAPAATGLWRRLGGGRLEALGDRRRGGQPPQHGSRGESDPALAWPAAVDALCGRFEDMPQHRGELAVVLSAHFTRLRLVPWSEEIGSPAELEAYARIRFEDVYGAAAASWAVSVSPEPAGCPRLAVAVEQALIDALQSLAQAASLRLVSLQPHATAAYNSVLPWLPRQDFMFAAAEPGRCSVLVVRGGRWHSVRSTASGSSDAAILAVIERECALGGLVGDEAPPVYLHVAGRGAQPWPSVFGTVPVPLSIGAAEAPADPWTAMALAEA